MIRWIDIVVKDLKIMGIDKWKEMVHDMDRWCNVVLTAKTLRKL